MGKIYDKVLPQPVSAANSRFEPKINETVNSQI